MRRAIIIGLAVLASLLPGYVRAADPATITRNEAASKFSEEIRFELEAGASQPIEEVRFLYALGGSNDELPAFAEAVPEFSPGTSVSASFVRDTSIDYLPVGVTLRYKWVLTQADGTITETPAQDLIYEDTRFDWQERSERGIKVRWYGGDAAWGESMLQAAVNGLDRLEERIGGTVDDPMTITIYSNTNDMRAALPPNSADWVGGQARADLGLIVGTIRPGNDAEVARLIPHELSHLVMGQATRNNYGGTPLWFEEGVAVVNQDIRDPGYTDMVEDAARDGELIPLRALASNFPVDPEKATLSYAQSESVIRFIEATYGIEGIARLVAEFKSGQTDQVAVQNALGVDLDALDASWRATLPAAQRTPQPVAAPDVAPDDRFTDQPQTRRRTPAGVVVVPASPSGPLGLPIWLWAVAGAGLLLTLIGAVWLIRDSGAARRQRY